MFSVYADNNEHFRGIWEWGMLYKEIGLDMREHLRSIGSRSPMIVQLMRGDCLQSIGSSLPN